MGSASTASGIAGSGRLHHAPMGHPPLRWRRPDGGRKGAGPDPRPPFAATAAPDTPVRRRRDQRTSHRRHVGEAGYGGYPTDSRELYPKHRRSPAPTSSISSRTPAVTLRRAGTDRGAQRRHHDPGDVARSVISLMLLNWPFAASVAVILLLTTALVAGAFTVVGSRWQRHLQVAQ
jgi:hypothetical protein